MAPLRVLAALCALCAVVLGTVTRVQNGTWDMCDAYDSLHIPACNVSVYLRVIGNDVRVVECARGPRERGREVLRLVILSVSRTGRASTCSTACGRRFESQHVG